MTWTPPLQRVPDTWDDVAWEKFGRVRGGDGDWDAPPPATPLITQVSSVEAQPVEWLWEHRVPLAALTLLDGHPDTGKSTISLDLASRLSVGRRMPDGSRGLMGATLLLSTEDTLARPVRERLEATEANLERVYGLEARDELEPQRPLVFPEDTRLLHEAIGHTGARLVVIDPIMAHLSPTINSGIDHDVRRALTPLVRVAAATGAAILMVRHLRKPDTRSKAKPTWLDGGGSSGGFGIVRAGLVATRDKDDESICTLTQTKTNYGERVRAIDYEFERVGIQRVARIRWLPR